MTANSGAPTRDQVYELQRSPDYWSNPDKQAQAARMLARIRNGERPHIVDWVHTAGGYVPLGGRR